MDSKTKDIYMIWYAPKLGPALLKQDMVHQVGAPTQNGLQNNAMRPHAKGAARTKMRA